MTTDRSARSVQLALAGVALVAALALGWFVLSPDAGPEVGAPAATRPGKAVRGPTAPERAQGAVSADAPAAASDDDAPERRSTAAEAAEALPLPPAPDDELAVPTFATAAETSAFVEARVIELLTTVAPELDPDAFTRRCSGGGHRCTFEGPWPGDDFAARWIRALGQGRTDLADLQGVRFSRFERLETEGGDRLLLEAHLPD